MAKNILSDLVIPGVRFDEQEYAKIKMRLDLYDDYIVAAKYNDGKPGARFIVDPHALAGALSEVPIKSEILPLNCLFWGRVRGAENIGIYIEPNIWSLRVNGQPDTWRVPLPGLVFSGYKHDYRIYAVLERPGNDHCKLYKAPVPNMSNTICRGNVSFPVAGPDTIRSAAIDSFFSSEFNNHLSGGKSKKYHNCILDHWRELNKIEAGVYPDEDLVEAGIYLKELME